MLISQTPSPRVDQLGIVVRDMEKAIRFFESLNLGAFRPLGTLPVKRVVYGKPVHDVQNLVRVTDIGGLQLELIQPVSGSSVQKEFLDKKGEGLNHIATFVNNIDQETAKLEKLGYISISSGRYEAGGGFAYFDTAKVCGVTLELVQFPHIQRRI